MPIAASLRFRLLLGLAKQIIFLVDGLRIPAAVSLPGSKIRPRKLPEIGGPVEIGSGNWHLSGWFVAPEGPVAASVLLFHGIGDRTSYWRRVQRTMAQAGISSLVFHYSGYPGSGGATTPEALQADAHAAYGWLRRHTPPGAAVYLLGFSLGSGLAAEMAAALDPAPAGLILAEAFPSLREAARRVVRPFAPLRYLLPDVWDTRANVGPLRVRLLVIHSTGDALFPVSMAEAIYAAARAGGAPAELKVLDGYAHNAPYLLVPEDYWAAVFDFIRRTSHLPG